MPHVLAADFDKCRDRFPGDAPFGADVKYEPVFENLKAEVLKLTAHSSLEGGVDWKSVKAWSLDILTSKSKDLTVASYLALALFVLNGYGGLSDGLAILQKYIQEDWDGMFPSAARPRNRVSTLEWLVTRLPPFIEIKAPEPFEVVLLTPLREQLSAFQESVKQRLAHETPSFSELTSALATYLEDLKGSPAGGNGAAAATPAEATPVQAAPPPGATRAAEPAPAVAPGTPADEIAGRIRALIQPLRDADLSSPVPYRVLRSLKWDGVVALPILDPKASAPGTTRIQPPRTQQRAALESLFVAGNWSALLNASEAAFQEGVGTFWLDLQRYTALALEGLGSARAAEAVKEEVARFVGRLETLPTFYFAERTVTDPKRPAERTIERTPFASEETWQWLETLKELKGSEEMPAVFLPAARTMASAESSLSPADARAAQDLLSRQQPAKAFDLLQAAVEKAFDQRSRFRTRLAAARLCFQANQAAWARALLETLLEESERFHFEDWEPETAADLYQLLALCYSRPAKKGGPQDPEAARMQIETLRRKLFRLDMRAAAELEEALRK